MGFWARLLGREAKAAVASSLELWKEIYGGRDSRSGESVNWKTAIEVSTVLACVRVLANGVAQVPFRVYREERGSRTVASDHPLHALINRSPNRWQTSYEFRETLMLHLLLCGNAFAFANRVGSARELRELVPIEPGRVEVKRADDGTLTYRVRGEKGEVTEFAAEAIWHVRGPSWNGWMGLEAVKLAREAIGLTLALEHGQAEFQRAGARPSGNYAVEGNLTPEKFAFLAAWLDKHMPGGERYGKPIITDMGAKYNALVMSAVDQQLIESRKFQIEEICRGFGVMPLMVGHPADMAARAATESIFLHHVVHSLMPWFRRIEESADVNLLSEADRAAGHYTKFTANALMRGAAKDRAEYYGKALGSGGTKGWMTQNEVRDLEEMDRSDDAEADALPQPTAKPTPDTSPEPA